MMSSIYLIFLKIFGLRKIKKAKQFEVIIENVDTLNTFLQV